jgi:hypothetical protein
MSATTAAATEAEVCGPDGVCLPSSKPATSDSKATTSTGTPAASASQQRVVKIDIVSDTICPWCYVGKRRLETALK